MNLAFSFVHKFAGADFPVHVKERALGLIHDFWHDGECNPWGELFRRKSATEKARSFASVVASVKANQDSGLRAEERGSHDHWQAMPGEINEIMWGEGWMMPADLEISEKLIASMSLKSRMSVLDLSAGLGRRARQMVDDLDVLVTGLESDPEIAVLGMSQSMDANKGRKASIANYDVTAFKLDKGYDAIVARELLYRVEPKEPFLQSLALSTNKNAFVSFTDYVVDPEHLNATGIKTWRAYEKQANPIGLMQMGEIWAKAGFYLINQEDLTPLYKKEILCGLKRLAMFLSTSKKPDASTKQAIQQELALWMYRMKALESGLRLFRFLGTKHG